MNFKISKGAAAALFFAVCTIMILFGSCKAKVPPPDPYEGMVSVSDGMGGKMWVTVLDNLAVSTFLEEEFHRDGEYVDYNGAGYSALRGIDVSEHQLEIDWEAVRSDGVEFAIIRAGYRGYSEGVLREDKYFRQNIEGAQAVGLKTGIYFFSQAITAGEAKKEAEYLLELIEGYEIDLPVFYDWEPIGTSDARTNNITGSELTDFALAFCDVVKNAGYEPGVYFYRSLGYHIYELDRLEGLVFWSAALGDYPDFYYEHSVWQYSCTAKVKGIETDTDLDIFFVKLPEENDIGDSGE